MKRHLAVFASLLALGMSSVAVTMTQPAVADTATVASSTYSQDQIDALNHLNDIREKAGLHPVSLNPILTKAAENHLKYGGYSHGEIEGKPGFTGVTPKDRVIAAGGSDLASAGVGEVMAMGSFTPTESIDQFMHTAYHRDDLLDPQIEYIGVAGNGGYTVIDTANYAKPSPEILAEDEAYPYNGQTNVDVAFEDNETPDPLAQFNIKGTTGFIISYFTPMEPPDPVNYTWSDVITNTVNFKLVDSHGNVVPCYTDEYQGFSNGGHFFPKQFLKYNETYTASVNYTDSDTGKHYSKTWSFTTMKDPYPTLTKPSTPTKTTIPIGKILIQSRTMVLKNSDGTICGSLKANSVVPVYQKVGDKYELSGDRFVYTYEPVLFYVGMVYSQSKPMIVYNSNGSIYKKFTPKQKIRVYSVSNGRYGIGGGRYVKTSSDVVFEK